MRLFIPTCNKYLWLIKPFSYLFNKFWDDTIEVTYLGYEKPDFDMPDNFKFHSFGTDDDLKYWSSDLRSYFNSIDDEFIYLTGDDNLLVDYVRLDLINKMKKYIKTTNKKIGRVGLSRDLITRQHSYFDTFEDMEIVQQDIEATHHISTAWSMWRRDYLLKFLKNEITPWEFEDLGTIECKKDDYAVISTAGNKPLSPPDNAMVHNTNALWRNWYKDFKRINLNNVSYVSNTVNLDTKILKDMIKQELFPSDVEFGSIFNRSWFPINLED